MFWRRKKIVLNYNANEKLLFQLYSQLFSGTLKFEKDLIKWNKENIQKGFIIRDKSIEKDDTYYETEIVVITNKFNIIPTNFLYPLIFSKSS